MLKIPNNINAFRINNPENTRELISLIKEDNSLFFKLNLDWQTCFASHPDKDSPGLGENLTKELCIKSRKSELMNHFMELPDIIKILK